MQSLHRLDSYLAFQGCIEANNPSFLHYLTEGDILRFVLPRSTAHPFITVVPVSFMVVHGITKRMLASDSRVITSIL